MTSFEEQADQCLGGEECDEGDQKCSCKDECDDNEVCVPSGAVCRCLRMSSAARMRCKKVECSGNQERIHEKKECKCIDKPQGFDECCKPDNEDKCSELHLCLIKHQRCACVEKCPDTIKCTKSGLIEIKVGKNMVSCVCLLPQQNPSAPNETEKSQNNGGAIAGGVVGTLVVLAIVAALGIFFYRKRKTRRRKQEDRDRCAGHSTKNSGASATKATGETNLGTSPGFLGKRNGTLPHDYEYVPHNGLKGQSADNGPALPAKYVAAESSGEHHRPNRKVQISEPDKLADSSERAEDATSELNETDYSILYPQIPENTQSTNPVSKSDETTKKDATYYSHLTMPPTCPPGTADEYSPLDFPSPASDGGYFILEAESKSHTNRPTGPRVPSYMDLPDQLPNAETKP